MVPASRSLARVSVRFRAIAEAFFHGRIASGRMRAEKTCMKLRKHGAEN